MLLQSDARQIPLRDGCVQCCVTSPPYFGLRDYGVSGQIGLEPSPDAYVLALVNVFREVRRVLKDDGVCWLNLGDSYATAPGKNNQNLVEWAKTNARGGGHRAGDLDTPTRPTILGAKPKDLLMIPARVALALQADGWYLRSDIIWSKPNPMPESVTDRPTKAHEYLFLLAKAERYYYDADAIREAHKPESLARYEYGLNVSAPADGYVNAGAANPRAIGHCAKMADNINPLGRNRRSVWTVNTMPYSGAHFATMPEKLVEPCILAGTSQHGNCARCGNPWVRVRERGDVISTGGSKSGARATHMDSVSPLGQDPTRSAYNTGEFKQYAYHTVGWRPTCSCGTDEVVAPLVFDPFIGSGTVGAVAERLGRRWVGTDLNPAYHQLAKERTAQRGLRFPAVNE